MPLTGSIVVNINEFMGGEKSWEVFHSIWRRHLRKFRGEQSWAGGMNNTDEETHTNTAALALKESFPPLI